MKRILLVLFLSLSLGLSAQSFIQHDDVYHKFKVGLHPNIFFTEYLIEELPKENLRILSLELKPYFAYNFYKNLYLGISFSYEFFFSNFYNKESFFELGTLLRYEIPYTINKRFFKRLRLYAEVGYYRTNYKYVENIVRTFTYRSLTVDEDFIIDKQLSQSKWAFPIGLTLYVTSNLYVDFNWQYVLFPKEANLNGFMFGLGYNIGLKK